MNRLHVLVVQGSDEAYGSDRICHLVVGFLRDAGMRVTVALPDDCAPGWLSAAFAEDGVPVVRLPLGVARRRYLHPKALAGYAWDCVRAVRAVRRLIRENDVDVVYLNSLALLPLLSPAIGRSSKVLHCHEIVVAPTVLRWVQRATPRLVRLVICVSDAVAAAVEGGSGRCAPDGPVDGRPVVVCRNGIAGLDEELVGSLEAKLAEPPHPARPLRIAFLGRLSACKGIDAFLSAADRLRDREDLEFVIAGGPVPGETEHLAAVEAATRSQPGLRYVGEIADGARFTLEADVLVVSSRNPDSYPTTVLEGQRAGCVVVASDTGGISEAITSDTGVLVPAGDIDALADALAALADDPCATRRMQLAARRHYCTHHDLDGFRSRFLATVVPQLLATGGNRT